MRNVADMARRADVSRADLERIKAALLSLSPPDHVTTTDAVRTLAPAIQELKKRGYSMVEILAELEKHGMSLSRQSLRYHLRRRGEEAALKPGRKRTAVEKKRAQEVGMGRDDGRVASMLKEDAADDGPNPEERDEDARGGEGAKGDVQRGDTRRGRGRAAAGRGANMEASVELAEVQERSSIGSHQSGGEASLVVDAGDTGRARLTTTDETWSNAELGRSRASSIEGAGRGTLPGEREESLAASSGASSVRERPAETPAERPATTPGQDEEHARTPPEETQNGAEAHHAEHQGKRRGAAAYLHDNDRPQGDRFESKIGLQTDNQGADPGRSAGEAVLNRRAPAEATAAPRANTRPPETSAPDVHEKHETHNKADADQDGDSAETNQGGARDVVGSKASPTSSAQGPDADHARARPGTTSSTPMVEGGAKASGVELPAGSEDAPPRTNEDRDGLGEPPSGGGAEQKQNADGHHRTSEPVRQRRIPVPARGTFVPKPDTDDI